MALCELFGLSSNRVTLASDLLREFGRRGGEVADNPDGWGVAYRTPGGFVLRKAPEAAARSVRFAHLVESVHSDLIIAHVRKANPPTAHVPVNTHPFVRQCCARKWIFAHNGKVPELLREEGCCHPHGARPSGETDSEHAFYFLLEEIATLFDPAAGGDGMPWLHRLATRSGAIAEYGQFNFLMSEGEHLIAYGHDRLHYLQRREGDVNRVLVASAPLGADSSWQAFLPGELRVYRAGELLGRIQAEPKCGAGTARAEHVGG